MIGAGADRRAGDGVSARHARPIPFRTEEIRALLAGRKTTDRRPLRPQPEPCGQGVLRPLITECPYGYTGDLLWVREVWRPIHSGDRTRGSEYRADHPADWRDHTIWHPESQMPRWASRLTLELTDVRVARVQEISDEEAKTEGVIATFGGRFDPATERGAYRNGFARTWDDRHARRGYPWLDNPWCWALAFRVYGCNVDQLGDE